jgi:hypothetical protein
VLPRILIAALVLVVCPLTEATAQKGAYCRGFEEGFRAIKGDMPLVPMCPLEPLTPLGSTPFCEGLKDGTTAANMEGGGRSGGGRSRASAGGTSFCDGFAEGYKTVKGNLALVPLCPLEPLTLLGSTAFREGIKAGMKKAGG